MPKTIEDIIPPSRRRQMNAENPEYVPEPAYTPPATQVPPPSNTTPLPPNSPTPPPMPPRMYIKTGRSFPYGTALIALVVVAICAGALYAFAGAEVQITPATQVVQVTGEFAATKGTGDLPFTTVTVTKTASVLQPAQSTVTENDSAQGTIVISNAQSKPQTLINNTRFQTPDGLVFRIHAPVTIPAATASGPGTLSATVFADQAGAQYNVGPTTFTLPGLANTATFALVTAKSAAPMIGGFSGTRPAVSQAIDDSEHATLQSGLASSLQAMLASQIPSGDVVIPGGSVTTYTAEPDTGSSTNSVEISEQGSLTAIAFPETALAKAIAYRTAGTYNGEPITLSNVNTLTLALDATSTDPTSATTLNFSLNGTTTLVWTVDASKIAGAVAGKTRDSAQSILSGFPEVNRAVLILRPFWSDTFPQDPSHIHVTVNQPAKSS